MRIEAWVDGSVSPANPGYGGCGIILIAISPQGKEVRKEFVCGMGDNNTNNRSEMTAALEAMRIPKTPSDMAIFSDSAYVVNAVDKGWVYGWKRRDWWTGSGDERREVSNSDIWADVVEAIGRHQSVAFVKVKGHLPAKDRPSDPTEAQFFDRVRELNGRAHTLAFDAAKRAEKLGSGFPTEEVVSETREATDASRREVVGVDIARPGTEATVVVTTDSARLQQLVRSWPKPSADEVERMLRAAPNPPDAPQPEVKLAWRVYEREGRNRLKFPATVIPVNPSEEDDNGKALCISTAEKMNRQPLSKDQKKTLGRSLRFVALPIQYSPRDINDMEVRRVQELDSYEELVEFRKRRKSA